MKPRIKSVSGALSGAAVAWSFPAIANLVTPRGNRFVKRQINQQGCVALTFDDGPQPNETLRMLDLLTKLEVKATFFVVGEHAKKYPEIIQEMIARGHSVQSHGYIHRDHLLRNPMSIYSDMLRGREVVKDITGVCPTLYRPPHGVVSWPTLRAANKLFDAIVLWRKWGEDWSSRASSESITKLILQGCSEGDILLLHDADWYGKGAAANTRTATIEVVKNLKTQGFSFVPLTGGHQLG